MRPIFENVVGQALSPKVDSENEVLVCVNLSKEVLNGWRSKS